MQDFIQKLEDNGFTYKSYNNDEIVIINGDCLKVMELMEDNSIDLVLTDPPYGDNFGYGRKNKTILNNESVDINFKFIDSVYSKLKENKSCYIFSNWKYEIHIRNYISDNSDFIERHKVILNKNNIGMGYGFRNKYEELLVFEKGKAKYNLNDFANVVNMSHIHQDDSTHPHEKAIAIFDKVLRHSTSAKDLVFDGFCGGGNSALSCLKAKRKLIACELDPKWYDYICSKLEKQLQSPTLFGSY